MYPPLENSTTRIAIVIKQASQLSTNIYFYFNTTLASSTDFLELCCLDTILSARVYLFIRHWFWFCIIKKVVNVLWIHMSVNKYILKYILAYLSLIEPYAVFNVHTCIKKQNSRRPKHLNTRSNLIHVPKNESFGDT